MPTPIGHTLAGWAVAEAYGLQATGRRWSSLALVAFVANLPDVDYLPGLLMGRPSAIHQQYTHSLSVAVLAGALVGLLWRPRHGRFTPCFLLFTSAYASHLLLDYLSLDTSAPIGLALFWPFSSAFFKSPLPVFRDVWKSAESGSFLPSLFVWHNLVALILEIGLLAPVVVLIRWVKSRSAVSVGVRVGRSQQ